MAEQLYLDSNNQVYGGDRLRQTDGTLDPLAPDRPTPNHQWNGAAWVLPVIADWETFRIQMMNDAAYKKMALGAIATAQGNLLVITLQDAITMPNPSIAVFQPLWNQALMLSVMKPMPADAARWQGYANSTAVGINFLVSGAIA